MSVSCFGTIVLVVAILLLSLSKAGRPSRCQIWKADIQRSEETLTVSRNYKGLWLSEKCEILPGPQYVLRHYHFLKNGKFHLTRFYYSDPWCTSAAFAVTVIGNFHPAPEKATASSVSWVVPGGLELDYTLRRMSLVPFTAKDAHSLASKVNMSCPGYVTTEWQPYKKYKVLSYGDRGLRNKVHMLKISSIDDMDCTSSLSISFNELQLMRLEHRTPLPFQTSHRPVDASAMPFGRYKSFLYLGAEKQNSRNRPTYYQVPLVPSKTLSCQTCRLLSKSSSLTPPELSIPKSHLPSPDDFNGHWISLRCEIRPYGLFLKREFFFRTETSHWTGRHEYFKDPQCKDPMFTLAADGTFSVGKMSKDVPDAVEYDFDIQDSTITPEDQQFANNLKGLSSCGSGSLWTLGQSVNLSNSGGCAELGIVVPSTELELIRFDFDNPELVLLHLGDGTEDHQRPTSFQFPLVQCPVNKEEKLDDDNLLFNDLRPMPLVSGTSSSHIFQSILHLNMIVLNNFLWYIYRNTFS